jgi:hypothetical protein
MPLLPLLFNVVFEVRARKVKQEKGRKGILIGKEVELSLCADDVFLYIENPKDSTQTIRTDKQI